MLYAKRKAVRYMCKQTVTQHLAKRDSRLPAYGSVVLQIFYFMKAFTRKNEFVMSYYFLGGRGAGSGERETWDEKRVYTGNPHKNLK